MLQSVRLPVPFPETPNTTLPPASAIPYLRSAPKRSRSTTTLPAVHAWLAPQVTAGAAFCAALPISQNSSVKSVAPTSAGGPGRAVSGSSMRILTRSTSAAPAPEKRSE